MKFVVRAIDPITRNPYSFRVEAESIGGATEQALDRANGLIINSVSLEEDDAAAEAAYFTGRIRAQIVYHEKLISFRKEIE